MMPEKITPVGFSRLWDSGRIREGDVLLFDRRKCAGIDIAGALIRSVQKRLLRDLGVTPDNSWTYSHVAVAGDRETRNILEMSWPAACIVPAEIMPIGTRIKVRRPRHEGEDIGQSFGQQIVHAAWRDIAIRRPYPTAELLTYWLWAWGVNKLLLGRRFMSVFSSSRADVCSGSVWRWCLEAGLYRESMASDLRPEAWYPGRLAADEWRFRTVGVYDIDL